MASIRHRHRQTNPPLTPDTPIQQPISTRNQSKTPLTITYSELEPWQCDNPLIYAHYRPASYSYLTSTRSLLFLHNESVNIYTHLLGALLSLHLSYSFHSTIHLRYAHANATDVLSFLAFFTGLATCLSCSALYHLFSNHSHAVAKAGNQIDYLGIVALIWGSFVPSIWLGFGSESVGLVYLYWGMITVIGAGCGVVTIRPAFRTPEWRTFRAGMFVAMGASAVVPVVHGCVRFGVGAMERRMALSWLCAQGLLYITGAGLYAARIPERYWPGAFDLWGASHQIFHVLVLAAAASHFRGLVLAFDYEHGLRADRMGRVMI